MSGEDTPEKGQSKSVGSGSSGSTILWDDAGDIIRGYIDNPKTTLFIIERRPDKPHRGRMTGAVIPDEDEKPDGLLGNALISWLQGCAAPMYLREFEDRLLARAFERENMASYEPMSRSATVMPPAQAEEVCEGGCAAPVVGYDSEGVPLCKECLEDLKRDSSNK